MRKAYRGTLIIAGGFNRDTAEAWLQHGRADLIAFGRKFLANPDLPERFRLRAPLNKDDPTTYYGGGAQSHPHQSSPAPRRRGHTTPPTRENRPQRPPPSPHRTAPARPPSLLLADDIP